MVVAARQKEFCRHTQLPAPGKKGRIDKRPESRWRKEKKTFRQCDKVAPMNDVDFLIIRLRRHQPTGQSKPFAKPQCPRFFRNERIGTGFDEKITDLLGCNRTTQPLRSFEQSKINRERVVLCKLDDPGCCGEPG